MAKKIMFGITIILLGVLLLLNNFGINTLSWSFSVIWPIFVFALGIGEMIDNRRLNITSVILIVLGLYFYNLDIITISFWSVVMPILLILIGIVIILPYKKPDFVVNKKSDANLCSVFSGITNVCESDDFQKADITAIFGGAELDLRKASTKGKAICNSVVVFGGVDIRLPEGWKINTDGVTCIFGGVEDSRKFDNEKAKNTLYITGTVIFGGIEIK